MVLAISGFAFSQQQQCQITNTSVSPVPITIAGCTFSDILPTGSTTYLQNTLSPTTTTQAFSVQIATATDSLSLGYISDTQCLHTVNGHVEGTGAECGSGGGGGGGGLVSLSTGIITPAVFTSSLSVTAGTGAYVRYGITVGSITSGGVNLNTQLNTIATDTTTLYANTVHLTSTLQSGATFFVSSGTTSGQLTVGTLQGASLSACGDSSHALSWSGGAFGCQSVTGSAGGVVSTDSPTWTGVHNWTNGQASTFTYLNATTLTTNGVNVGTQLTTVATDTTTLKTQLNTVATDTTTLKTNINSLGVSTGSLQTQITATGVSTGTLLTSVINLGASTGTLLTSVNNLGASTGTIRSDFNTSTGTLQTNINAVGVSTGSIAATVFTLGQSTQSLAVSTGSIASTLFTMGQSTQTLAVSTGSLKTSVNSLGASTGTLQSNFPVSLSTNTMGTLPAAGFPALTGAVTTAAGSLATVYAGAIGTQVLPSTIAYITSTQTYSGAPTFASPSGINVTFGVVASSVAVSSAAVNGQLTVSTLQGASLTTCGDASHGLSWTGGSFGCQSITGTAGGVVASASPTWTGVHNWANTQRSTFTVAPAFSGLSAGDLVIDGSGVITSTPAFTPNTVDTLTNKTIDAEAAGNTITIPFDITYKAGLCQASTATLGFSSYASSGPIATCLQSTSTVIGAASFVDSSTNTVQDHFRLPSDWTGNIDLQLVWTSRVTVGTVAWEARTACVSSGTLNAPTFNAYNTVNSVAVTQANAFNEASMTALTTTGCTANSEFNFEIARNGSAVVNDTHKATAQLITAMFTIRRAM